MALALALALEVGAVVMVVGRGGRGGGSIVVVGLRFVLLVDKEELVLMKVDALILGYTSTLINLLTFEVRKRKRKKRGVN